MPLEEYSFHSHCCGELKEALACPLLLPRMDLGTATFTLSQTFAVVMVDSK
jgi:hypothetical protein